MHATGETAVEKAVGRARERAARCGRTQWIALRAEAPASDALEVFGGDRSRERFFWERPAEGRALAASGAAHTIEVRGTSRFGDAAQRARALFEDLTIVGEASDEGSPRLVGGFAFADSDAPSTLWSGFPSGRLTLPERLYTRVGKRAWWTVVCAVEPNDAVDSVCLRLTHALDAAREAGGSTPTSLPWGGDAYRVVADGGHDAYRAQAEEALAAIAAGDLEKVVIARAIRLERAQAFDPRPALASLRKAYPSCATFGVSRDEATFLGATPEHLVVLEAGRVTTAALAGSAPRGRNAEEDRELARALAESKKEQAEHAVVVRALLEALADRCRALEVPESPRVRRLDGIQHLETPIAGELVNGASILELVDALHPTPAVAGAPRQAALSWIAQREPLERGWYAGPIGFVNTDGGGEFALGLRAALLRGGEAQLFAGAGIVAGSQPEAELRETTWKLRALLFPLLEI